MEYLDTVSLEWKDGTRISIGSPHSNLDQAMTLLATMDGAMVYGSGVLPAEAVMLFGEDPDGI